MKEQKEKMRKIRLFGNRGVPDKKLLECFDPTKKYLSPFAGSFAFIPKKKEDEKDSKIIRAINWLKKNPLFLYILFSPFWILCVLLWLWFIGVRS